MQDLQEKVRKRRNLQGDKLKIYKIYNNISVKVWLNKELIYETLIELVPIVPLKGEAKEAGK